MSADRELLELAAKAAGIAGEWVESYGCGDYYYQGNADGIYYEHASGGYSVWNPLTDDGDALRLAIKLRINIMLNGGFHHVGTNSYVSDICQLGGMSEIRREIVMAAAEIGRNMLSSK